MSRFTEDNMHLEKYAFREGQRLDWLRKYVQNKKDKDISENKKRIFSWNLLKDSFRNQKNKWP